MEHSTERTQPNCNNLMISSSRSRSLRVLVTINKRYGPERVFLRVGINMSVCRTVEKFINAVWFGKTLSACGLAK